jgi:hypothetical protein
VAINFFIFCAAPRSFTPTLPPKKPTGLEAYEVKIEVLLNVFYRRPACAPSQGSFNKLVEGVARFPHPNG